MSIIEIKVPVLPESVADATIATWHKKPGDAVKQDDHLVDIETDKVVLEVVAPEDGTLESITHDTGDTVKAQEVIALFKAGKHSETKKSTATAADTAQTEHGKETSSSGKDRMTSEPAKQEKSSAKEPAKKSETQEEHTRKDHASEPSNTETLANLSPSARRKQASDKLFDNASSNSAAASAAAVSGSNVSDTAARKQPASSEKSKTEKASPPSKPKEIEFDYAGGDRIEKRVPMTRLRARIAERLIQAQQTAAILTTFNEINMQPVMNLRQKYKDRFEKQYGVRLGFMSFFAMAVVEALKHFPIINASIDGNDIVYHGFFDIGIAVSSPRGLVVPVLRNVETLTMAEIEKQILDYSSKAQMGQLSMEDITGGTFTLSNGGVFGSLMSTPILNPPQSGILGMHKIQERAVVENGTIVVRPMMYVALSYDHRIIDGSDSVRFLVTVKELLEDPARLTLGI